MKQVFITGIGTDVGKTVISAILTEHLQADYWKPIQSGDLHNSDSMKVKALISNSKSVFHLERYRLNNPLSPHASAEIDGIRISLDDFELPRTDNNLIVEGAGGLFVPINEKDTVIDLIERLNIPVVLVSRNYLGSINHTMLSIEALKARNIKIEGIIFNGVSTPATERFIEENTNIPVLFRVEDLSEITPKIIQEKARNISPF
jgi:dethiobiotin synthetase